MKLRECTEVTIIYIVMNLTKAGLTLTQIIDCYNLPYLTLLQIVLHGRDLNELA